MPKLSEMSDADLERLMGLTSSDSAADSNTGSSKRPQDSNSSSQPPQKQRKTVGSWAAFQAATQHYSPTTGKCDLFADTPWFARPPAWRPVIGQHYPPNAVFQRISAAAEKLQQAHADPSAALQFFGAALNSDVSEGMKAEAADSLFAEAARLVFGILGISCEGYVPAPIKSRITMNVSRSMTWPGVAPQPLIGQWFSLPNLINTMGGEALRACFELAPRQCQTQFISGLSRLAMLEVGLNEFKIGKKLRPAWSKILERYPEIASLRTICAHVRRRCWEDARDRSRSRSPGEERRKRMQEQQQNQLPPGCIRFFVKKCGNMDEFALKKHFQRFGKVWEATVLYDKKTSKPRGMAFVMLRADGWFEGKRVLVKDVRKWVLEASHIIDELTLEVTEAEQKAVEDEVQKVETRVEERRRARLEREHKQRKTDPHFMPAEEKLVLSLWAKRWRQDLWMALPKEYEPLAAWNNPRLLELTMNLWGEVTEHIWRTGSEETQLALHHLFVADEVAQQSGQEWTYIPCAELMLIVGEGFVGVTAEGIFACSQGIDPPAPPSNFDKEALRAVPLVITSPQVGFPTAGASPGPAGGAPTGVVPSIAPPGGCAAPQVPQPGAAVFRASDAEKVFIGGLTPSTTTDMLKHHFGKYGNLVDAVVMMDRVTNKPRGFGFVVFDNTSSVDAVIQDYQKHRVDGKWVEVKRACPQDVLQGTNRGPSPTPTTQSPIPTQAPTPSAAPTFVPAAASPPPMAQVPPPMAQVPPPQHHQVDRPPPTFVGAAVPPPNQTNIRYDPLAEM
eukprot:CAMPEP_0206502208 /NCGR_PEP_ID=MMETSP0324_2-20121206/53853_1 /ASSEMBLY_ACC=CAM_ASM_000836 /TAXON_ID=2866 /ORGANISM="Crypthecodinium cohnii, Strain Seligo" /LENGTH=787 /DNA_ID=CAMNT_0053990343 /DNA_START=51 /DNA_END=2414 /DNA_ORIENTATION=+